MALLGNLTGSAQYFNDKVFYNGVATQSLRFDRGGPKSLNRTPSSASNRKTWTWSGWIKPSIVGQSAPFFTAYGGTGYQNSAVSFNGNSFRIYNWNGSSNDYILETNSFYRDSSAWYHIAVAIDTTQGTASNRIKVYINGEQITSFSTETYPSQNFDGFVNSSAVHKIGSFSQTTSFSYDGYMAEVNFVDGLALDPTYFAETKNGVWIAKEYTGSYGTNGFRLQFNQTGTGTASSSTIGADTSGNDNHWTSSGIVASDCNMPDSPENNFATLNPLWNSVQQTYAEGNLKTTSGAQHSPTCSTIGVSSGKWYVEGVALSSSSTKWSSGIFDTAITYNKVSGTNYIPGQNPTNIYTNGDAITYYASGNDIYKNGSQVISNAFSSALTTDDIIQIAFDVDNGKIWYGINNSWNNGTSTQGSFDSGNHDTTFTVQQEMRVHFTGENNNWLANFGQDSSFAGNKTAQGNTDGKGIGDFYYAPPSGFLALCTSNLPEPTISPNADTQADDHFNTVLFTGNGGTKSVTGLGFQPDWFWGKSRTNPSGVYSHSVYDSSRGVTKRLLPDLTNAESTTSGITSFDADGFTLGSNAGNNNNNATYVNWCWKANGGTTSSNTDGSITSTVQANTDAGFSIVTWTGNATLPTTIGHGLGKQPLVLIVKNRDDASTSWFVHHHKTTLGSTAKDYLNLNDTGADANSNDIWGQTRPTTSVFTVGVNNQVNGSSDAMIAYCFAEIEGYSKFGSYTGNGNADGAFVYTGFRPAWVLVKRTDSTNNWMLSDSVRDTDNVVTNLLYANLSNAEYALAHLDFTSNGFKLRTSNASWNASGGTYIYMAFAENPFKYANAR